MAKLKVKHVKFTPAEMAYDGPSPGELKKWTRMGRGKDALFRKPAGVASVTLASDVARYFGSDEQVNDALRGLIQLAKQSTVKKRKRSA